MTSANGGVHLESFSNKKIIKQIYLKQKYCEECATNTYTKMGQQEQAREQKIKENIVK